MVTGLGGGGGVGCGGCGGGERVEEALGAALQGGEGQNRIAIETKKEQVVHGERGVRGGGWGGGTFIQALSSDVKA
jgi:hypothetical protein